MVLRITFFSLVFICTYLPGIAHADACGKCQRKQKSVCAYRCDGSKNRLEFDACSRRCVERGCSSFCGGEPAKAKGNRKKPQSKEPQENCADCIRLKEGNDCATECDVHAPRYEECKKRCAKRRCQAVCYMPDPGLSSVPRPAYEKYACERCRENAEYHCASSARCEKDTPGEIACRFACVQERCAEECATENEEPDDGGSNVIQ